MVSSGAAGSKVLAETPRLSAAFCPVSPSRADPDRIIRAGGRVRPLVVGSTEMPLVSTVREPAGCEVLGLGNPTSPLEL